MNTLTPRGFEQGMALLREAITLDPTEPLAYAGLARGYSQAELSHDLRIPARFRSASLGNSRRCDDEGHTGPNSWIETTGYK